MEEVIDIGAGTGRIALAIAGRGTRVVAFEAWLGIMIDSPASWAGEVKLGKTTYRRTVARRAMLADSLPEWRNAIAMRALFHNFRTIDCIL